MPNVDRTRSGILREAVRKCEHLDINEKQVFTDALEGADQLAALDPDDTDRHTKQMGLLTKCVVTLGCRPHGHTEEQLRQCFDELHKKVCPFGIVRQMKGGMTLFVGGALVGATILVITAVWLFERFGGS